MANKKAIYHRDGWKPIAMQILKTNEDKTLDLGDDEGQLIVSSCPITDEPKNGCCTVGKAKSAAKESKPAAKDDPAKAAPAADKK